MIALRNFFNKKEVAISNQSKRKPNKKLDKEVIFLKPYLLNKRQNHKKDKNHYLNYLKQWKINHYKIGTKNKFPAKKLHQLITETILNFNSI